MALTLIVPAFVMPPVTVPSEKIPVEVALIVPELTMRPVSETPPSTRMPVSRVPILPLLVLVTLTALAVTSTQGIALLLLNAPPETSVQAGVALACCDAAASTRAATELVINNRSVKTRAFMLIPQ